MSIESILKYVDKVGISTLILVFVLYVVWKKLKGIDVAAFIDNVKQSKIINENILASQERIINFIESLADKLAKFEKRQQKNLRAHAFFARVDSIINHEIKNLQTGNDTTDRYLRKMLKIKYNDWKEYGYTLIDLIPMNGTFGNKAMDELDATVDRYRKGWEGAYIPEIYRKKFIEQHHPAVIHTVGLMRIIIADGLSDNMAKALAILNMFVFALDVTIEHSIKNFAKMNKEGIFDTKEEDK